MQQDDQQTNEQAEKPIVEEKDWSKPDYIFIPKGNHLWMQQGYYLVCSSCDLSHATFIGKDMVMVGEDGGGPILKKRRELGMA